MFIAPDGISQRKVKSGQASLGNAVTPAQHCSLLSQPTDRENCRSRLEVEGK